MLLLLVGIAIAYDTFFAEDIIKEVNNGNAENLGSLAQFVKKLSDDVPVLYGMASIVLALVLGVGAAIVRKQISILRKKYAQSMKMKKIFNIVFFFILISFT